MPEGKGTSPASSLGGVALKPPKQSRSRRTLDRIAVAALSLIEEVGVEGATVAKIVDRAGASVGSFYARFPGKEDLVRYLQLRVWTEARESWDQEVAGRSWGGLSVEQVVEGVVGLLIRALREDFQRRKVLGQERSQDPEATRHAVLFHEHLLSTITSLLQERLEEISHPDPEVALELGYRAVVGAIREILELETMGSAGAEGGTWSSVEGGGPRVGKKVFQEVLAPELARLWGGYLNPPARESGSGPGEVDFFDPWG